MSQSIQVCRCLHGLIFHPDYGFCQHPMVEERTIDCKCKKFTLAWGIWDGKKMSADEYYNGLGVSA